MKRASGNIIACCKLFSSDSAFSDRVSVEFCMGTDGRREDRLSHDSAIDSCHEILKLFAALPQRQGNRRRSSITVCHADSTQTQKKGRIAYHHISKKIQDCGDMFARLGPVRAAAPETVHAKFRIWGQTLGTCHPTVVEG